jgi:hypothetical protein
MTNSVIRLALTSLAFTAGLVGCTQLDKKSTIRETITKEPDAAFLKRVKNDPFPAAGQAPKTTPATATETNAAVASSSSPAPLRNNRRTGVLGQPNVTATTGLTFSETQAAMITDDVDATAVATDETPPPATPAATPTGTATGTALRPLTTRNNIRPLNRPLNGATRRN